MIKISVSYDRSDCQSDVRNGSKGVQGGPRGSKGVPSLNSDFFLQNLIFVVSESHENGNGMENGMPWKWYYF